MFPKASFLLGIALCASKALAQTPITTAPCPDPTIRSLHSADWIWTTEITSSLSLAPLGSRAFRFKPNLPFPPGQQTQSVSITIAADDEYEVYLQGRFVGTGNDVQLAQVFEVALPAPTDDVLVAVNVTNRGLQAGLIVSVQLGLQCGSVETIPSMASRAWKFFTSFPEGWQDLEFDDSAWLGVFDEGGYGIPPWGNITVPPASTPPSLD